MTTIYIVDTGSWIELKNHYPIEHFPSVWNNIEELIKKGRLLSCREVLEEIRCGDDELVLWCKNMKHVFHNTDAHIKKVQEIISKYKKLINHNAKSETADPYIIALAISYKHLGYNPIIVTEENQQEQHIPDVADKYGVKSFKLIKMIRSERWRI